MEMWIIISVLPYYLATDALKHIYTNLKNQILITAYTAKTSSMTSQISLKLGSPMVTMNMMRSRVEHWTHQSVGVNLLTIGKVYPRMYKLAWENTDA